MNEDALCIQPANCLSPEDLCGHKKRAFDGDREDLKQLLEKEEYLESKRIANHIIGPASRNQTRENVAAFLPTPTATGRQRLERTRYFWRI